MRIIQAIALAAAVLGLLLTTPSLEARTHKKPARKKMKIVFDGSAPAVSEGELGDEIAARSSNRQYHDKREVVRLRGGSIDDAWKKSALKKSVVQDENPDLIEPSSLAEIDAPASKRSSKPIELHTGSNVDESALGSFAPTTLSAAQTSKRVKATKLASKLPKAPKRIARRDAIDEAFNPQPVVTVSNQTRPAAIEDTLDFDDVKPRQQVTVVKPRVPVRAARSVVQVEQPQSKIYLRNVQPVARAQTRIAAQAPSEFKFNFAFENTTSMGRSQELQTPGGRNYMMKNEIFIGTEHSSGWGAQIAANYVNTSNDDTAKDVREMGDPSIIVKHPSLYKSVDIHVYGQARYYLPVAAQSKRNGLHHLAYSLFTEVQLVEGLELANDLTGRYYVQSTYADDDAFGLIFDRTEIGKRFDIVKLGVGQRTQIESHQAISPGTSVEFYPFAELLAVSNTVIQARFYLPVLANGVVKGAPQTPSGPSGSGFSNAQAELFARVSF